MTAVDERAKRALYFNGAGHEWDDGRRHHKMERIAACTSDELTVLALVADLLQQNRELIARECPIVPSNMRPQVIVQSVCSLVGVFNSHVDEVAAEELGAAPRGGAN